MAFGDRKRVEELEAENASLRQWVEYLKGVDAVELAGVVSRSQADLAALQAQLGVVESQLAAARAAVVVTNETALLQEVGVYDYRHPLDDAVAYKSELQKTKDAIKTFAKNGQAVQFHGGWQVNGSLKEGERMTRDLSKLMLRAYNSEADNIVRTLKPHALKQAIERLNKAREAIARLGTVIQLRITDDYHRWRVYELELTADYLVKVDEERERAREEAARRREEEKAIRELEAERRRLEKEQGHYQSALEKLRAKGDEAAVAAMEAMLVEIESAIAGIESREANIRAGYVYVISNFGSFGAHVVKIGMTRRLEPMDRVRELGDASVPFRFDVHAMIFSDDAVGLEGALHERFADRRVNLVNLRREYFYVAPQEVRDAIAEIGSQQLLEFHDVPEASEWRASGGEERAQALLSEHTGPATAEGAAGVV